MAHDVLPFRPGLLRGVDIVFAPGGAAREDAVAVLLAGLGADLHGMNADLLDEDAASAAASGLARATVLVCDAGALMRAAVGEREPAQDAALAADREGPSPGRDAAGLRAAVEGSWNATRAVVNAQLVPAGFGKVVLIAPRPADGADAAAAGAALGNLARTTSVEWARLGIRVAVVRPRDATSDAAVAQCVAYLSSPAGDYVSGSVMDLGLAPLSAARS